MKVFNKASCKEPALIDDLILLTTSSYKPFASISCSLASSALASFFSANRIFSAVGVLTACFAAIKASSESVFALFNAVSSALLKIPNFANAFSIFSGDLSLARSLIASFASLALSSKPSISIAFRVKPSNVVCAEPIVSFALLIPFNACSIKP